MTANSTNSTIELPGAEVGFGFVTIIPGILANIFAIVFFTRSAKKTGSVVHYLLLSLSVTDLFGCFLATYTAATAYTGDIQSPILCNALMFITSLCPMSTALMACLLALDRYVALCHPFKYAIWCTKKRALRAITLCMVTSILISMLPFFQLGNYYMVKVDENGDSEIVCSALRYQDKPHQRIYGVLYGTFGICIIVLVIISNLLVIKSVLSMRKNIVPPSMVNSTENTGTANRVNTELKFVKMVAGISVVLLFCWTPFMVLVTLVHTGYSLPLKQISPIMILASLNFIIDPFVHIFLRKSYRQAVWRTVFCCDCFRPDNLNISSVVQQGS